MRMTVVKCESFFKKSSNSKINRFFLNFWLVFFRPAEKIKIERSPLQKKIEGWPWIFANVYRQNVNSHKNQAKFEYVFEIKIHFHMKIYILHCRNCPKFKVVPWFYSAMVILWDFESPRGGSTWATFYVILRKKLKLRR